MSAIDIYPSLKTPVNHRILRLRPRRFADHELALPTKA
jgi:hypothetical protein